MDFGPLFGLPRRSQKSCSKLTLFTAASLVVRHEAAKPLRTVLIPPTCQPPSSFSTGPDQARAPAPASSEGNLIESAVYPVDLGIECGWSVIEPQIVDVGSRLAKTAVSRSRGCIQTFGPGK